MKKLLLALSILFLLLVTPVQAHASTYFQDAFTDTDSTDLSTHDSTWVHSGDVGTEAYISSNQVTFPFANGGSYTLSGFSSNTDQCVATDYAANGFGGSDFHLNVRNTAGGKYEFSIGDGFWLLKKRVSSTNTLLGSGSRVSAFNTITSLKLCAVGTVVDAYLNGTLVKSVSDSSISAGTAGLSANQPILLDNFIYTDGAEVSPYPTPVPPSAPEPTPTLPVLFEDSFTGTNSADLQNHKIKWVNQVGHAYIFNNKLNFDYADANFDHFATAFYTLDGFTTQGNQCVSTDFDYNSFSGSALTLYARYSSGSWYQFGLDGGGTWRVKRWNSSTLTTLDSGSYTASSLTSLKFCVVGTALAAYLNGSLVSNLWDDNIAQGTAGLANGQPSFVDNFLYTDGSDVSPFPAPANTTPSVNSFSGSTINEGGTYSASGSFTDPSSTSWSATVDYGDGGGAQSLTLTGKTFSLSHVYADNAGPYTVTVAVTDNQSATGQNTASVTVNDLAPTTFTITAATTPVVLGNSISASANFTDPGVNDTHTATWIWGDGTSSGTVTESGGSGSVSNNHTYAAAGVYEITLTVTDDSSAPSNVSRYKYVAVYNSAHSKYFSGANTHTSPTSSYPANTALTGPVQFGFAASTQGGSTTGQVKMNFSAANLEFVSTSISSLATPSSKGTLTGSGTINGSGSYTFTAKGIDTTTDVVRIQIKDGSGTIVYDSQPGAADNADPTLALTSGNIIVH